MNASKYLCGVKYLHEAPMPRRIYLRPGVPQKRGLQTPRITVVWHLPSYQPEENHAQAVDVRFFGQGLAIVTSETMKSKHNKSRS